MYDFSLRKAIQFELSVSLSNKIETMSSRLGMSASAVVEQLLLLCLEEHAQGDLLKLVKFLDTDTNFAEVA